MTSCSSLRYSVSRAGRPRFSTANSASIALRSNSTTAREDHVLQRVRLHDAPWARRSSSRRRTSRPRIAVLLGLLDHAAHSSSVASRLRVLVRREPPHVGQTGSISTPLRLIHFSATRLAAAYELGLVLDLELANLGLGCVVLDLAAALVLVVEPVLERLLRVGCFGAEQLLATALSATERRSSIV
jgi:hypothetical protein